MCRRPLRWTFVAAAALAVSPLLAVPASASLLITVDKSAQRMTVALDDQEIFNWPVSTGQRGYDTPSGEFKPFRMEKDHFSREWDDAPMPNSIFFTMEGHAIHGTNHMKALGTPASHGCVRLSVENSETLWRLVKQEKMANTKVVLKGEAPPPAVASADPNATGSVKPQRPSRNFARGEDDPDFTYALPNDEPQSPTTRQRSRQPNGAAYFDGRYYYDRQGRRIAEAGSPRSGGWTYGRDPYERGGDDYGPRGYRRDGFFSGWR
ncbi:MAG: L,D-transpeptidase [Pseudolabrys sp.]|nr:L,D-transpeptidase [Pseudolabrys sp.]